MGRPPFIFFKNPLSWVVFVLVPFLLISAVVLLTFGFFIFSILIITSLVLILSTLFITFHYPNSNPHYPEEDLSDVEDINQSPRLNFVSKAETLITQQPEERLHQIHEADYSETESSDELDSKTETLINKHNKEAGGSLNGIDYTVRSSESESIDETFNTENNEKTEERLNRIDQVDYLVRLPDLSSESEQVDESSTTEDYEIDWEFKDHIMNPSPDFSDGSISDEETLIEIAIPTGHYVGHDNRYKLQEEHKFIFQQHSLMELFAEFNEEDNLIEIDISMGSIKCSRFEIEA